MSGHARFEVKRGDLAAGQWREIADAPLAPGEARLAVRLYSLTSNNITYGLMGEGMGYWDFFPAPEGFGAIPVWGFADVVESQAPEVKVGERFYGYLPMGDRFVVQVGAARPDGFSDIAPHRAKRAPVYNRYVRAGADPLYDAAREAEIALFRPLFATAFVLDFYLANADFFGAEQVILASASSKTALATAFMLSRQAKRAEIVGLTSPANRAFCEALGVYDRIILYDDVQQLDAARPAAFVDMAGAGAVQCAVHTHFADKLVHSLVVGVTHYGEAGGPPPPGTKQSMFFAPDQFRLAAEAWGGAQEFDRRMSEGWNAFGTAAGAWLKVTKAHSRAEIAAMYQEVLAGKTLPERGNIVVPQS